MNCWNAGCSAGGYIFDFRVQVGLHESNLESSFGSHESGVRVYIGLDNILKQKQQHNKQRSQQQQWQHDKRRHSGYDNNVNTRIM
jgi:hypothetical protein